VVLAINKHRDKGNKTIGNSVVAALGIASVIHQTVMQRVHAKTPWVSSDKPSGAKK
jgi:hypothetical protein